MTRFFLLLGFILYTTQLYAVSQHVRQEIDTTTSPNIIVIMADDHGQWASAVYGNPDVRTPNMRWLADNGVAFSHAYAVSPVCSPSRASFFTGRMPSQHGVHDFLSENPNFDHGWLQGQVFLSELLQEAGYKTALVGKWHATTNSAKVQRGFDFWFSYDVGPAGWSNQYQHRGNVHYSHNGQPTVLSGLQTPQLTDKAMAFMDQQSSDQPIFLFLGFVDTHAPFEGQPERLVAPFRSRSLRSASLNKSSYLPPRSEVNRLPNDHLEQLAQYYAGVELMDQQVGRLIDYLEAKEMLDNTIIIYTSDHGHMNGHHGLYGKGNATRPQNFYQESILVPLSITWRGRLGGGAMEDAPVSTVDLYQTIVETAQVEMTPARRDSINSPGRNIVAYLQGHRAEWSEFQYSELGNARMIANQKYKYVQRLDPIVGTFGDELYDLQHDPGENKNVLEHPNYKPVVQELESALEAFFDNYHTPQHSGANLAGQPSANPNEQWRK